jgi:hypothetical protein
MPRLSSRFPESPRRPLHGLMRCVPAPQDVRCSVDVGMVAMFAGDAAEDRLAFAAPGIDDTARRARLRGVGRIDAHHPTATFLHLVGEFVGEAAPALGKAASVEASLLTHVAARFLHAATRGGSHVGDLEILEHAALSRIAQPRARRSMGLPPPDRGLFEDKTIDQATSAPPEQPVSLECRRDFVAPAAMENRSAGTPSGCIGADVKNASDAGTFDSFTLCTPCLDDKQEGVRFLPGVKMPKDGASARDSR